MYHSFFSYARQDDSDLLTRFFQDLRQEVMDLVVCGQAEAAFLDTNQGGGVDWERNVPEGLMTSKVMICVHSPAYFQKPYCGKEVQVFLQRRKKYISKNPGMLPTNILPVSWIPSEQEVPLTLPKFTMTTPKLSSTLSQALVQGFNQEYRQEGLKYMLEAGLQNKDRNEWYVAFKRTLAREIRDAGARFPFDETDDPGDWHVNMASVRDAFKAITPVEVTNLNDMKLGLKSATFLYVGDPGWEWDTRAPFAPPPQNTAGFVSSAVAEKNELEPQKIPLDVQSPFTFEVLKKLCDGASPVVVLVDRRTMQQPAYQDWLLKYDKSTYSNCTTLVVGRSGAPDKNVEQTFEGIRGARPDAFFHPIPDADSLNRAVESSLATLHDVLINSSPMKQTPAQTNFGSLPLIATPGPAL